MAIRTTNGPRIEDAFDSPADSLALAPSPPPGAVTSIRSFHLLRYYEMDLNRPDSARSPGDRARPIARATSMKGRGVARACVFHDIRARFEGRSALILFFRFVQFGALELQLQELQHGRSASTVPALPIAAVCPASSK